MPKFLKDTVKVVSNQASLSKTQDVYMVDEHNLDLYVNNKLVKSFTCINEYLDEIVTGWLIGAGYIKQGSKLDIVFADDNHKAFVEVLEKPKGSSPSSFEPNFVFKNEWIFDLVNRFLQGSDVHKKTSGTHCCILSINGKIMFVREDIGRHNAIDKMIGRISLEQIDPKDCVIFTSGRISSDLVSKVINAQIPVLVSKSVTSYQAAQIAKGKLRLICKAWPDSFEIYT